MTLVWRWIIVCMLAVFPIASHALALGKLKVLSALNEPLNAEIEFTSITEKELKGLTASLASRADFNAASVERLPFLSQIKFIIAKKLDGRYFLELHTEQEVNEPFLHLLLQIDWSGGRLVREYTGLIDPPYKIVGKAAPVDVPKITAPAPIALPPAPSPPPVAAEAPQADIQKEELPPVVARPEEPKAEEFPLKEEPSKVATPDEKIDIPPGATVLAKETAPEEPVAPKVEPLEADPKAEAAPAPEEQPTGTTESKPAPAPVWAAMSEYNVKRGDVLWSIAEKVRANNKDISTEQVILAIYRANKDAFFANNVNNLKAGKILKIPEREAVESVTSPEARREFRAQYDTWQEYKLKLASASRAVKVADAPETPSKTAGEQPAPPPVAESEQTKPPKAPPVADKKKQEELLKIVRNTLQQEKSTPDKKITEKESAKDATAREQQALAERTATLEETLESKRLENKDLSEKLGVVRSQLKNESRLIELESQSLAPQQKKPPETKPAEPIVKPAEQPAAPKPEEKAKVESLPPVAKPAPVPSAAPKKRIPPAPAPAEEKGFLASMLEALQSDLLVPGVIGIVVLLTGGIALVYFRRRQKSIAEFEESILSGDAISTEQPSTGDSQSQGAVTTGGDTSFLSDFSQGGMGNIHTDEVDPVAEAEVYLAYGRDETAEEILKEAVVKHPERHELKLKLLEIYHQRNDVSAFETLAEELYAALGGRGGKIWEKVEEMGRKLNPENPMFRGGAPAKSSISAKSAAPAAAAMAPMAFSDNQVNAQLPGTATKKPETVGDFDFDIEAPAVAPAPDDFSVARPETPAKAEAGSSLESIDLGAPGDNAIEFDAGEKSDVAADFDLSTPDDAAPAGNDSKLEPESATAAAPAAESQGSSQWDETATKLDLAKAYIDMGDAEGARSILQEVMAEGNVAQKQQAQELSTQLA